ncbi:hypothetical protein DFP72DRAFT_1068182 [Ephemerocybe angulata]|uniref:Uncharacterized protein n=1 Tax=Ephemerocybe angulata TaxID=980116 RepID=A0A8H6I0C9_9AGAR|nr:hypothetical protein DFP72DRAFT_1068182 [Tulosesus angulatus]
MVAERGGSALSEVSASGAQVAQDTGDSQVAPQAPPEATPPQTSPLFTPRRRSFGTIAADDSTAQSTPVVSGGGRPRNLSLIPFGIGIPQPRQVPAEDAAQQAPLSSASSRSTLNRTTTSSSTLALITKANLATKRLKALTRPLGEPSEMRDNPEAQEANEKEQGDGDEPMDEDGEGDGRKER